MTVLLHQNHIGKGPANVHASKILGRHPETFYNE
jgi:hypothetical protein